MFQSTCIVLAVIKVHKQELGVDEVCGVLQHQYISQ